MLWRSFAAGGTGALHKIDVGDKSKMTTFNRDVLGKILCHKEFEEGCKTTCKGPYDGKWSKTMVCFGPEDDDFVAELIYNYGVGECRLGNDFLGLTLQSSQAVSNAKRLGWPLTEVGKGLYLAEALGGYHVNLVDKVQPPNDPVQKVCLAVKESNEEKKTVLVGFTDTLCKLEFHNIIAFSCSREQLAYLEALMTKGNHKIFTVLVSLDAPGKAWLAWMPVGKVFEVIINSLYPSFIDTQHSDLLDCFSFLVASLETILILIEWIQNIPTAV
uniref:Glyoxalase domain-containing protein n=1 Tax=Oncorhynchus tshawytscha TaxID=74940 RepID=A0A8C8HNJ5_ONCTS